MKQEKKKQTKKKNPKKRADRISWGDVVMESPTALILIAILAIAAGLFMILLQNQNRPIPREEAVAYTGEFTKYRWGRKDFTIYFADGNTYAAHPYIRKTGELADCLDELEEGTVLHLLINPNNHYVVEVKTDSEELLNFEATQTAIISYDKWYAGIGVFMCLGGGFLIVYGIVSLCSRKREERRRKARSPKGSDSQPLRPVQPALKSKILLDARVKGYTICYRRMHHVNELVVNGQVYDERRGIIEFEHCLRAVVDGHTIEAGLDERSFSYIRFDGRVLAERQRLI